MEQIIGLKELREDTETYVKAVERGKSFVVMRRSKPLFKITPLGEETDAWETVVDFTEIRKAGVPLEDILKRL